MPPGAQGLDRYAYVNNNPLRCTDPSGNCPLCVVLVIGGVSITLTAGEVILLAGVTILTLDAILPGAEQRNQAFVSGLQTIVDQASESVRSFYKGEYVPSGLSDAERNAYREAVHKYKKEFGLGATDNIPKWICDEIAELLKDGVKPEDIPFEAPAIPEEEMEDEIEEKK